MMTGTLNKSGAEQKLVRWLHHAFAKQYVPEESIRLTLYREGESENPRKGQEQVPPTPTTINALRAFRVVDYSSPSINQRGILSSAQTSKAVCGIEENTQHITGEEKETKPQRHDTRWAAQGIISFCSTRWWRLISISMPNFRVILIPGINTEKLRKD